MTLRFINYLTILVLVCLGAILVLNVSRLFNEPPNEKYIKYNDVKGMAIEHKGQLFTLNFSQQRELIGYINRSLHVSKEFSDLDKADLPFTRLIIYRFSGPDLVITPVGNEATNGSSLFSNPNLIYYMPEWYAQGYLSDTSSGKMLELISKTYDP